MSELPHLDLGSEAKKDGQTYGFEYRITLFDGDVDEVSEGGFATREEAMREFEWELRTMRWTPPRWWQWWRWKDYPRKWPV